MTVTIDELLNALQSPDAVGSLENNKNTWERIGRKDSFEELGLSDSELEGFLTEWIGENPYENI